MVEALPSGLAGKRDRALLLVGFASAMRRSELVALDVSALQFTRDGLVITVQRSKTDQEGRGVQLGIPWGSGLCPVRALQAWITAAGMTTGAVFRSINRHGTLGPRLSSHAVAQIVKRAALGAGLDPALYAGHSLRAGFATSAAQAGVEERSIMRQTRHRSVEVARRYIRQGTLFTDNPLAKIAM